MAPSAPAPADPLAFIQSCVKGSKILWTYHVNMRLQKRSIGRDEIVSAVDTYEIIEAYPNDKYMPSYLLLASGADGPLHVLFATDVQGDNVRVVTGYRPDPNFWDTDFKKRIAP